MVFLEGGHNTAVIFNDSEISYSDLLSRIGCYSEMIPLRSKVALVAENRPEWIYVIYAAWHNEAIPVIFDLTVETDEFAAILNDAEPDLIFVSQDYKSKFNSVSDQIRFTPHVVELDEIEPKEGSAKLHHIEKQNLDDTAIIIYTSGTTDNPKGVILSFNNLLSNIEASEVYCTSSDCGLVLLPLYHIYPLVWTLLLPLFAGIPTAFCPSLKSEDLMNTLQRYQPTGIAGVPKLFELIRQNIITEINKRFVRKAVFKVVKKINSLSLSKAVFRSLHEKFGGKVRYLICGGAPIDVEIEKDFKALGFELQTGYGLTETSPMVAFNRPGKSRIGTVGTPLACNDVRLVDGEILVKGTNVMKGYYNKNDETEKVLKDGWLQTGDLGVIDKEGYLTITGRKKSLIVLANGKNLFPEEIESKLLGMSEMIKEVAVYEENKQLTAAIYPDFDYMSQNKIVNIYETVKYEILEKYNRNAASHKKINRFFLVRHDFPKTSLGKIKRYQIESFVRTNARAYRPENASETLQVLIGYLTLMKSREIFPDDHIEIDAGLDSLEKIHLLSFVESSFGITVKEEAFSQLTTVQQIADYIEENKPVAVSLSLNAAENADEFTQPTIRPWPTYPVIQWALKLFFRTYLNMEIKGIQNVPSGPVIFAPNQQSTLDAFFISVFLSPCQFKNTYYLVKEKHFASRWKKILADGHHAVIVDIHKNIRSSIKIMASLLKNNKSMMIFPEGTRTGDGSLSEFKTTFAILSREQNVPVVPVCIAGSLHAMPRGRLFPKKGSKIMVEFLRPVEPDGLYAEEITQAVFDVVKKSLQASQVEN